MNELQIFENPEFGSIRTLEIDGEPWFLGKDVAEILSYTNTQKAIRDHVDDEDKLTERIVLSGQNREVIFINESGLYSLILSSKLPTAKQFKRWVTSEVLPAIRKTGTYIAPKSQSNPELAKLRADAMMLNAKSRIAKQMMSLWTAAGVEPQYQALAMNNYYDGLSVPRIALKAEATAMYDLTTIAKHLGVMSKSGKPHSQAIGAIVDKITIEEGECELTPYSSHGHDGVSAQYTLSVEHKVKTWLEDNLYPNQVEGNGKKYTVKYDKIGA
ncbi:MAG: Bro-N domain-containing protein [Lachnospiraceae bacterium]|nr:Bro-N domain-containing protein [Lachnospiraceae bacterium]